MKAGPKASVDDSPLPWRPRSVGSARFGKFCERYVKVPKGTGARSPLKLRSWQRDLVGSVLDADPRYPFSFSDSFVAKVCVSPGQRADK